MQVDFVFLIHNHHFKNVVDVADIADDAGIATAYYRR